MKKFNCGSYSLDRGEVSSIIVIGLIQSDCSWLRGYEGHGSRHDVELEEILFHNDPHHVPAYLLYGEETLKNRFGQDGSDEKPWTLTFGTLYEGFRIIEEKDSETFIRLVTGKWDWEDCSKLFQYCIFGDMVFKNELKLFHKSNSQIKI